MKLVLDTVPNHVGAMHPWVTDEPTPNWFHGTKAHHMNAESNFDALIDPHAPESARTGTLDGWFADVLPDMDTDDPTVALYLRQNAIWWIEQTGADALRIDTFPYVNREFWHEFNGELKQLYPKLTEVGEIFNLDPIITSSFAGGVTRAGVDTNLTTPFDFPTYFAFRDVFAKSEPMTKLASTLGNDSLYPHPEQLVTFFGNHDTKRFLSDGAATPAALHLAFGLLATMRGMPQIYSGDEIAMTGGDDPDNRHDFPGGFTSQSNDAFIPAGRSEMQASMLRWVQTLMQLRGQTPALQTGQQQTIFADKTTFAFARTASVSTDCLTAPAADRYLVIANDSSSATDITLPLEQTTLAGCTQFTSVLNGPDTARASSGKLVLHIAGQGLEILRAQP
jgi:glycosidase